MLFLMENAKFTDEITNTAASHQALRRASHNILYTIANSEALERNGMASYGWAVAVAVSRIIVGVLLVLYFVRRHIKIKKWKAWKASRTVQ